MSASASASACGVTDDDDVEVVREALLHQVWPDEPHFGYVRIARSLLALDNLARRLRDAEAAR